MAKTLADYLMLVEKEYEYKIKLAATVTEKQFYSIEMLLQKYDLIEVKSLIRLPYQNSPTDFYNLPPTEVYVIDIVTRMPLSSSALVQEIHHVTGLPLSLIVVRGKDDPIEQEEEEPTETIIVVLGASETDAPEKEYGTEFNKEIVDDIVQTQGMDVTASDEKIVSMFQQKLKEIKPVSVLTNTPKGK